MTSQARHRDATYEDLLALPDDVVGQIIEGELYATPRPAIGHQLSVSMLGGELVPAFHSGRGGPGGWWIVDEPELHLGRNVLVPDLAGWRRERLPALPPEAFFTLAPDWVCEVLSPATARIDRLKKLAIYAREEVEHAWLVDPVLETLEVYRRQGEAWLLVLTAGGDDVVRAEPFDAIELTLTGLWIRPA
ncbi:MAG: Uma2 family endonuclease [Thermoanaerobaculia bacterium]